MHLGNGAITPECGVVALGVAAIGAGVAVAAARVAGVRRSDARTAGALGAVVFAAQLFNVGILPLSSVHLVGGVLLAWVLGPALGALTMTAILTLQAVLLGDGGLLALGVNTINMGLLPAAAVAMLGRWRAAAGSPGADRRRLPVALTLGATAFLCTVAAAGLIVLEVSIGRGAEQLDGLSDFAARMVGWHAVAGLLEAVSTVAIVAALEGLAERRRCGLPGHNLQLSAGSAGMIGAAALLVAVLSAPAVGLASSAPDGYQAALAAADNSGMALGQLETGSRLTGINRTAQSWQDSLVSAYRGPEMALMVLATVLAGISAGGIAIFGSRGEWRTIH